MLIACVLIALLAFYALLIAGACLVSLKPPRIPLYMSPGMLGLPEEEVEFASRDGVKLRGWWVQGEPGRPVCVFAHGYVLNRSELVPVAHRLWQRGWSCLLFDFRGHGSSGGRGTTIGWLERWDVAAAAELARRRAPGSPLVAVGSSMGAAAAALAWGDDPALFVALVIDGAYSRQSDAARGWWRFLGGPVLAFVLAPTSWFLGLFLGRSPSKVDVAAALRSVAGKPMLFLNGDRDPVATRAQVERNVAAAGPQAEVLWFEGCTHGEGRFRYPDRFMESVTAFLERSVEMGTPPPTERC